GVAGAPLSSGGRPFPGCLRRGGLCRCGWVRSWKIEEGSVWIMRPAELNRLTVVEAADRYVELVRAKALTGALSPATVEVYARDVATFVRLAGPERVLDDLD